MIGGIPETSGATILVATVEGAAVTVATEGGDGGKGGETGGDDRAMMGLGAMTPRGEEEVGG